MATENIRNFNVQVLRLIAKLYKAHPAPITISSGSDFDAGTIQWMYKNGYIIGDFRPLQSIVLVPDAQLSANAFRILQRPETNSGGESLGEFALSKSTGDKAEDRCAELLVKRLLDG